MMLLFMAQFLLGRRLSDPLAELVKLSESHWVGQYQHDVDQTKLKRIR
jgi:transcriptional accessory protein Tex/SPT6